MLEVLLWQTYPASAERERRAPIANGLIDVFVKEPLDDFVHDTFDVRDVRGTKHRDAAACL